MEIWKDIVGYEGLYQVSDLGRVKSLTRTFIRSNGRRQTIKERVLSICTDEAGYPLVYLHRPELSKGSTKKIHRLVAIAHIENPNEYEYVNHKNGVKSDCQKSNLEWCTQSYNCLHAFSMGLRLSDCGEGFRWSKLNNEDVADIRQIYAWGRVSLNTIGDLYDVTKNCIWKIVKYKNWKHLKTNINHVKDSSHRKFN